MVIELEPSFLNRTGRRNDKSARGHETAQYQFQYWGINESDFKLCNAQTFHDYNQYRNMQFDI
jgi:hypothetical protein